MTTTYKYPLVSVIWDDAESDASWSEVPTQALKPALALTVGFLIVDEPDYILIADSYFLEAHSKTISNTTKIPRGMIKELSALELKTKPTTKKKKKDDSSGGSIGSNDLLRLWQKW